MQRCGLGVLCAKLKLLKEEDGHSNSMYPHVMEGLTRLPWCIFLASVLICCLCSWEWGSCIGGEDIRCKVGIIPLNPFSIVILCIMVYVLALQTVLSILIPANIRCLCIIATTGTHHPHTGLIHKGTIFLGRDRATCSLF